jgi:hypothetical protein
MGAVHYVVLPPGCDVHAQHPKMNCTGFAGGWLVRVMPPRPGFPVRHNSVPPLPPVGLGQ